MKASANASGLVNSSLLEKIDKLFACNAGEYVDLPQLVVVGDQSSGKSSILEGLTGLPFPRDSGLCTRFATQITFRRATSSNITASVIPSKGSSVEHREKILGWKPPVLTSLDVESFASIMKDATNLMGVGNPAEALSTTFSKDVLRLEISGPDQEHFSVIDVPGIFKRTTQGVTTKEDIVMVDEMVRSYMSNPRSVMLTVIPSNVDIATQEILEKAEELDPAGIRTLGVLTKPDLVDSGAEKAVTDLINGKKHPLTLGWHLVRNPGQAHIENSSVSRAVIEKEFFQRATPWNSLDGDKVGIEALRIRLQDILAAHIQREFPKVKNELTQKLNTATKALQALGPKRQGEVDQRLYLMDIALEFQRIAGMAINSSYSSSNLFTLHRELRLATLSINRGEYFARMMTAFGHTFDFSWDPDNSSDDALKAENPKPDVFGDLSENTRLTIDDEDLTDILDESTTLDAPEVGKTAHWLKSLRTDSRGFELGTFDPALLSATMKEQASKWEHLALGYVSDIIADVHRFVNLVLDIVAPDSHVKEGLKALLIDELRKAYQKAIDHTIFLLQVELDGRPATHNHYFNEMLQKCRQQRLSEQLKEKEFQDADAQAVVRVKDIIFSRNMNNEDHVMQDIHDILMSYYKLALKRFVDNVRMHVADHHLIIGPDTPLKLFSAKLVTTLTAEQLEEIAGEEDVTKRRRSELQRHIEQLETAKQVLR